MLELSDLLVGPVELEIESNVDLAPVLVLMTSRDIDSASDT